MTDIPELTIPPSGECSVSAGVTGGHDNRNENLCDSAGDPELTMPLEEYNGLAAGRTEFRYEINGMSGRVLDEINVSGDNIFYDDAVVVAYGCGDNLVPIAASDARLMEYMESGGTRRYEWARIRGRNIRDEEQQPPQWVEGTATCSILSTDRVGEVDFSVAAGGLAELDQDVCPGQPETRDLVFVVVGDEDAGEVRCRLEGELDTQVGAASTAPECDDDDPTDDDDDNDDRTVDECVPGEISESFGSAGGTNLCTTDTKFLGRPMGCTETSVIDCYSGLIGARYEECLPLTGFEDQVIESLSFTADNVAYDDGLIIVYGCGESLTPLAVSDERLMRYMEAGDPANPRYEWSRVEGMALDNETATAEGLEAECASVVSECELPGTESCGPVNIAIDIPDFAPFDTADTRNVWRVPLYRWLLNPFLTDLGLPRNSVNHMFSRVAGPMCAALSEEERALVDPGHLTCGETFGRSWFPEGAPFSVFDESDRPAEAVPYYRCRIEEPAGAWDHSSLGVRAARARRTMPAMVTARPFSSRCDPRAGSARIQAGCASSQGRSQGPSRYDHMLSRSSNCEGSGYVTENGGQPIGSVFPAYHGGSHSLCLP